MKKTAVIIVAVLVVASIAAFFVGRKIGQSK